MHTLRLILLFCARGHISWRFGHVTAFRGLSTFHTIKSSYFTCETDAQIQTAEFQRSCQCDEERGGGRRRLLSGFHKLYLHMST